MISTKATGMPGGRYPSPKGKIMSKELVEDSIDIFTKAEELPPEVPVEEEEQDQAVVETPAEKPKRARAKKKEEPAEEETPVQPDEDASAAVSGTKELAETFFQTIAKDLADEDIPDFIGVLSVGMETQLASINARLAELRAKKEELESELKDLRQQKTAVEKFKPIIAIKE